MPFQIVKTLLDINSWPRKEHFHFFWKFEEPFFGAVVEIDCTKAYANAKELSSSFFNLLFVQDFNRRKRGSAFPLPDC